VKEDLHESGLEKLIETPVKSIESGEIIIGTLTSLDHQGKPLVDFPGNVHENSIQALSITSITLQHAGRQVALSFVENNIEKPIIMGLIHNPLQSILENFRFDTETESDVLNESENTNNLSTNKVDDMLLDGDRVVFEAKKEIVLKCGESSITLTKAGKILIKGKYLVNRSSGVNRIIGGSVQIN